jgi:hypothetical protein
VAVAVTLQRRVRVEQGIENLLKVAWLCLVHYSLATTPTRSTKHLFF